MASTVLGYDEWAALDIFFPDPYVAENEQMPENDRLGKMDTAEISRLLQSIEEHARSAIATAEAANEPISHGELGRLQQHARAISNFPRSSSTTVAVIGHMGVGKSTVINAVLNVDICRTSAWGSAGTQVAVAYRYPPSNDQDDKTVNCTVMFFTAVEINSIVKIFRNALRAHYKRGYGQEYRPTRHENEEKVAQAQKSTAPWLQAISWLEVIVKLSQTQIQVSDYVNRNAVLEHDGAKFIEQANKLANQAILSMTDRPIAPKKDEGASEVDVDYDNRPRTRRILSPSIATYEKAVEPFVSGRHTALVKEVVVEISSPALQHGTIIKDLPGVGDAHLMRTYITRHGRRADRSFIVAVPDRAKNDKNIEIEVRTAVEMSRNGAQDIHLIFTRCDELARDHAHVDEIRAESTVEPFLSLRKRTAETVLEMERLKQDVSWKTRSSPVANELLIWSEYCAYLEGLAGQACIIARNRNVESAMKERFADDKGNDIDIRFISPLAYDAHREGEARETIMKVEDTGIPSLRAVVKCANSESRCNEIVDHVKGTVTQVVQQLRLLCLEKSAEKEATSSVVQNIIKNTVLKDLQQLQKRRLDQVKEIIWTTSVLPTLPSQKTKLEHDLERTMRNWHDGVAFNTTVEICRQGGWYRQLATADQPSSTSRLHQWSADVEQILKPYLKKWMSTVILALNKETAWFSESLEKILANVWATMKTGDLSFTTLDLVTQDMNMVRAVFGSSASAAHAKMEDAIQESLTSVLENEAGGAQDQNGMISKYVGPSLIQFVNDSHGEQGIKALEGTLQGTLLEENIRGLFTSPNLWLHVESTVTKSAEAEVHKQCRSIMYRLEAAAELWKNRAGDYSDPELDMVEHTAIAKRLRAGLFQKLSADLDTLYEVIQEAPLGLTIPMDFDKAKAYLLTILGKEECKEAEQEAKDILHSARLNTLEMKDMEKNMQLLFGERTDRPSLQTLSRAMTSVLREVEAASTGETEGSTAVAKAAVPASTTSEIDEAGAIS